MKLRVGLIGLGDAWQQCHAPALRALANRFEIRVVFEQVGHLAEQAAAEFSAASVDGYRALARREDIDAVLILSPQWYGPLPILAACESGKAVYCAAGLDLKPEEARSVKRRVEEAGVAFMAEFPRRQAAATLRLKELIATRLGAPRLVFCHQRAPAENSGRPAPRQRPHSCTVCEMIELVDWCRYVVGADPKWVSGVLHPGDCSPGDEDYQMMTLEFARLEQPAGGAIAQISCGRYIPGRWQEAINYRPLAAMQVSCREGIAFVDLPSALIWFDEAGRHQESLESERPAGEQLLDQFYRVVTGSANRTCDLEDAYQAIRIVQQARRSHLEGRRIEL